MLAHKQQSLVIVASLLVVLVLCGCEHSSAHSNVVFNFPQISNTGNGSVTRHDNGGKSMLIGILSLRMHKQMLAY